MHKKIGSLGLRASFYAAAITSIGCVTPKKPPSHTCPNLPRLFSRSTIKMDLKKRMEDWNFSEPTLSNLPMDHELENFVRRNVPKVIFSQVRPTPFVKERKLVAHSSEAMGDILDMDPTVMSEDPMFVDFVAGNHVLEGSIPISHRYGGHQFGVWAGQLGDGRAILLGEYANSKGEHWELQLKGAGRTPYSRFGDGRAVLRSSIREYICSEAMFHLGVPTSRAAAIIVSEDRVMRDMFYDGNPKMEKCSVVLRLAPTWFRIGSLQILTSHAEVAELNKLMDYVIETNFSHLLSQVPDREDRLIAFYAQVVEETAFLIAKWTSVGFVHGVMNTDNLSLASITIDYGPFGFVDDYDAHYTPNHSDDGGRYDFANQPDVAEWNLKMLAMSLMPIIPSKKHDQLGKILKGFEGIYARELLSIHRQKLGLKNSEEGDQKLVDEWISCMKIAEADLTMSWRQLSEISDQDLFELKIDEESQWALHKLKTKAPNFKKFLEMYRTRLEKENYVDPSARLEVMQAANPRYIPRQWMLQRAIEKAENDDFSEVRLLQKVLKTPFKAQPEAESAGYAKPVPDWSKRLLLSCSS